MRNNPLSATSINTHIPTLQDRSVEVRFGALKPAVEKEEGDIPGEMMDPLEIEASEAGYIYRRRMGEGKDVIGSK